MIDSKALLKDLRRLLRVLDDDLRIRIGEQAEINAGLQAECQAARDAGRTGGTYTAWLDEEVTQAAAHWILGCVFVRFLEDNYFLDRPYLSGPTERVALARDRHEQYFRAHPRESDREYLLACFREVARLPGMAGLFDERHNPVFRLGISGDRAMELLTFWQKVDPDTGRLVHDFIDPERGTRFLGDLYQDLSESARKRYALLQTPIFVEELILDRTLTPAIGEFGYREVRLIDPTCGSGHFLLGAFQRLFDVWARHEPARNLRDLAQQALNGVYGVDVNPFAVAIAHFRLLLAALTACDETRLTDAPAFTINLAAGDSLLHGRRFNQLDLGGEAENLARGGLAHVYQIEDRDEISRILGQQYHVVVGNPPYITVKDAALNAAYRSRYATCHMKYSLAVPFTERFFELAITGDARQPAGFVGMITTNSFMKREFGSKLIESFLPHVDLTHVIDTAGAYIPGHGTPTVILFGRGRPPVGDTVRTVMGIKGEPTTPADPAQGLVWRAILSQVDRAGSESAYVSVTDMPRATFGKHPWSIGGGGASALLEVIADGKQRSIEDLVSVIGVQAFTLEDEAFVAPQGCLRRSGIPKDNIAPFLTGVGIRDWTEIGHEEVLFPYDRYLNPVTCIAIERRLWLYRRNLEMRVMFRKTQLERGQPWFAFGMFIRQRFSASPALCYSFVATHNHFAIVQGNQVLNRHAPIFVFRRGMSANATEDLLGLLNSSVGCFWMKLKFHNKGSTVDEHGARQRTDPFEDFFEYSGSGLGSFPLVANTPTDLAGRISAAGKELEQSLPASLLAGSLPTRASLDAARSGAASIRRQMVALQEELDWRCYRLYGLIDEPIETENPPEVALGERAFEIVLARRMAAGEETTWFARHGSTPITEVPPQWPEGYQRLVERRIALIEFDRHIGLIERPEYKRRWNAALWEELEQAALRSWLLDRLEDPRYWRGDPQLKSVGKLADAARLDADLMQVAELYTGRGDFDAAALVAQLVESESVPFLPVLCYAESGLHKRAEWEACWEKQRREDAVDAQVTVELKREEGESEENYAKRRATEQRRRKEAEVGDIPVPPKYKSTDFLSNTFWRLRGGLDVPKERFVSHPHCSRDADGSLVVAWAGWDHLQQATALSTYYFNMKDNEGWAPERLKSLLAGIQELVPWLKQWHNEYDPEHATRMGDYFASFVIDEARGLGFILDDLRAWKPTATGRNRGRRARSRRA